MLSYIYWDPAREMLPFPIPLLNRPILWYGFFFALGFFLAYWVLKNLLSGHFKSKAHVTAIAERMTFYVVIGSIVGARLGDVIFYQRWTDYVHDPLSIIKVWEGGLASHGGAVGIIIALWLCSKKLKKEYPSLSLLRLLDYAVIPTALAACFIRIGNFFNQEILGKPSDLPWAVLFGHPADGSRVVPRHPAQLYESIGYLIIFLLLLFLWKRTHWLQKTGKATGLFLILVFTFRFCIEFLKTEQSFNISPYSFLDMGQYLSIPFIALGLFLFFRNKA